MGYLNEWTTSSTNAIIQEVTTPSDQMYNKNKIKKNLSIYVPAAYKSKLDPTGHIFFSFYNNNSVMEQ